MKFNLLTLAAVLAAGSIQAVTPALAFEFPTMTVDGDRMAVVPLPPRRGQGGSAYAIVSQAAARYGVPLRIAHAVIAHESGHNCRARNRSGAAGLGQLMPGTARALGVHNPMDCTQNANGAMKYLGRMIQMAGGNLCLGVSAYNTGHIGGCTAYGRQVLRRAS